MINKKYINDTVMKRLDHQCTTCLMEDGYQQYVEELKKIKQYFMCVWIRFKQ